MDEKVNETPQEETEHVSEDDSDAQADDGEESPEESHVSQPEESAPESEPKDSADYKEKFERLRKKVGKLEKDAGKAGEFETAQRVYEALNKAAQKDPKFALEANKALMEEGVITQEEFDSLKSRMKSPESDAPAEDIPEALLSHPAIRWAQEKAQSEKRQESQFFDKFEEEHEDISDGSDTVVSSRRQTIGAVAKLNIDQGMTREDAFNRAYLQVMHPEKLKEEGEIEGLAKAQSTGSSIAAPTGQSAKPTGGVTLSQDELDAAKRLGMSPEDYAAAKDPNYGVE